LSRYKRISIENRLFEGDGLVSVKLLYRRGRPPTTIFARIDKPRNALQLCRWRFSHKETL